MVLFKTNVIMILAVRLFKYRMIRNLLFLFSILLLIACQNTNTISESKQALLFRLYNIGSDTLYQDEDSMYYFNLMPIILNLSNDTVGFVNSIYGRDNYCINENVSPKYGIYIYKNGKKVDFKERNICANYGFMLADDIELIPPFSIARPFGNKSSNKMNYTISTLLNIRGEIEIEAYYNTLDTNQLNYHPLSLEDFNTQLGQTDYNNCRSKFLKVSHVYLRSNKLKLFLK